MRRNLHRHSHEFRRRLSYTGRSRRWTFGVTIHYSEVRMDRRRQPLPDHRVLVWLDPTEVRVQGLWMGFRRSRGVNYGLARRQRWRFRVPGLRPHEAEATRHRRRTLGRSRRMGVSRGHFWRVPWSWRDGPPAWREGSLNRALVTTGPGGPRGWRGWSGDAIDQEEGV